MPEIITLGDNIHLKFGGSVDRKNLTQGTSVSNDM
jgi:hypothetical protein